MSLIIFGMKFSEAILDWYSKNKRELPWRTSKDPYHIWLSEIILQQTRVAQGIPYYLKFREEFPTVHHLARADEDRVLKLWQGLGYYSRARNLLKTAKIVSSDFSGKFPDNYDGLIKLPGIGDYTASAIASICFDRPEPVVDGNVYRVLARYFGVDLAINSSGGTKYFKKLAREVIDPDNIRDYNQAIMEFGAVQCTPANPDCSSCPLKQSCKALSEGRVSHLPVKIRNNKVKDRYFNYLVGIDTNNHTRLVQRIGDDIWKQLYEFPLLETTRIADLERVSDHCNELLKVSDFEAIYEADDSETIHKLSHQRLHTKFWIVETSESFEHGIPVEKLDQYPVPVPIADFIKTFKNSYF